MPYRWEDTGPDTTRLRLWPHQSLPPAGFALFIGATSALLTIPLLAVLGTAVLWALLPFLVAAVGGAWFAISRSRLRARVLEELTLDHSTARLVRHDPDGGTREWDCNRYWAEARLHPTGGLVPNYVTLRGGGREVEIGAFLSEEERRALYDDLSARLRR